MSLKEYVKENFKAWLEERQEELYESTALDGFLLAMLIWAIILYALGLSASDYIVAGIGGLGFVGVWVALIVKGAVENFHEWQRERL